MKADNVLATIGNTPHIRLSRLFPDHEVWVKSERANPGGSIKDRIALAMVEAAEKDGSLKPGGTIIEPTSGNTGIGLAMAAAVKGYKLILVMPESMSLERRRLMLAYGATFDLTPKEGGMKGAIERAHELVQQTEVGRAARAEADHARMTRNLIDHVLDLGGTYYLPYRPHATRSQLRRAYTRADEFVRYKRQVDPDLVFRNLFWDRYLGVRA